MTKHSMTPHPKMKALSVFVGTWNTEGEIANPKGGKPLLLRATDTYEFLPGGHFLLHKVDARLGDTISRSIEIYGYDSVRKTLTSRSYDDQGASEEFVATLHRPRWSIEGETLRFKGAFNRNGTRLKGQWHQLVSGAWVRLMTIVLTKA